MPLKAYIVGGVLMETTTILQIDNIEYRITEINKDEQKLIKKLEELIKKLIKEASNDSTR
jgi:uncharacterized protein (DUF302 family)